MKCFSQEHISRYLDGELSTRERESVESHLRDCPECRAMVKQERAMNRSLRFYGEVEPGAAAKLTPECLDTETLLAFADGSISDEEEQRRIDSHLAVCDACARKAAGAMKTARLVAEIEKILPEPVPPYLREKVRERLFPEAPVRIGRIFLELGQLWKQVATPLEYPPPVAGYRIAPALIRETHPQEIEYSIKVDREPYDLEEKARPEKTDGLLPAKKKRKAAKGGLAWAFQTKRMGARVEMRATPSRKALLKLNLFDDREKPLAGIRVTLLKEGKKIGISRTGKRGGASFCELSKGGYRLLIRHRPEYSLDLDIT
jgi:hypothetical protein